MLLVEWDDAGVPIKLEGREIAVVEQVVRHRLLLDLPLRMVCNRVDMCLVVPVPWHRKRGRLELRVVLLVVHLALVPEFQSPMSPLHTE